jgi:hypothetical protein
MPWLEYSGRAVYLHKSGREFYFKTMLNNKPHRQDSLKQKETLPEELAENIEEV